MMKPKHEPTEPGWYWATNRGGNREIVEVVEYLGQLEINITTMDLVRPLDSLRDYCGPLVDPLAMEQ